jgi:glycosyltransferase involved in cell wall biosynthesis
MEYGEEMSLTLHNRLSLCMIVKNEEDCIERCLQSVKDIVDEMIIVDTGSTDRTPAICSAFGAKVYDFAWSGSFAAARNYSLEQATGDWILWLDADEEVDSTDGQKLRDILQMDSYDVVLLHLVNYYGEQAEEEKVFHMAQHRLFRNHKGFKFTNHIHEVLDLEGLFVTEAEKKRMGLVPIKVYHYGYLDPITTQKNKFQRNVELLQKELQEPDYDPWVLYYLASEYYGAQEYDKAFQYVNKAVLAFMVEGRTPPSMIYKLKYTILLQTGNYEGAWPGIEAAVKMYPDYVDLHYFKGVILYLKQMYQEAIEALEECLKLGEEKNLEYLSLKGAGSFYALYYQGRCYQAMGQTDQALLTYIASLRIYHTFSDAIEAIKQLLDEQGLTLEEWMEAHAEPAMREQLVELVRSCKIMDET